MYTPDFVTNVLSGYGLAGLTILALALAHVYIHKENQKNIREKDVEIARLSGLLLENANKYRDSTAQAMEQQAILLNRTYDAVVDGNRRRR